MSTVSFDLSTLPVTRSELDRSRYGHVRPHVGAIVMEG
jgi:hypothetical protein